MNSPFNTNNIRKELFDISLCLTPDDVKATNFFIRSETTSQECKDTFEMMKVLEKLAYFQVSQNKVHFKGLIELLGNINRVDLQKRLQTYADKLLPSFNNSNESSSSIPLSGDEKKGNSSEPSDSLKEETNLKGNNSNESSSSIPLSGDEKKGTSSEPSDLLKEETNLEGNNSNESSSSIPLSGDEKKGTSSEPSDLLKEETNLEGNNSNESSSSIPLSGDEKNGNSSEPSDSLKEETNLKGQEIEEPSASVTSSSAADTTELNTPQTNTEGNNLEIDYYQMPHNPEANINALIDSSLNEESSSDETSSDSEDSSSGNITLYNYQLELGVIGKTGANSIICSPTGSGKTITAASIIKHNMDKAKQLDKFYRVLYLVHIRYLVKHLAIDLKKILGDEVYSLEDDDLLTSEVVQSKAVVILTAQILDNALNSKSVELSDYDLLLFDECHNTVHKHPYNEIMKKYHTQIRGKKRVPQILGLSATLAGGSNPFQAIVDLCANMYTPSVSCVCDKNNLKELSEKNKAPIIDEVIPCKSRLENDKFIKEISKAMMKYIIDLEEIYKIKFGTSNRFGSQGMESFLAQQKKECEIENLRVEVKIFDFLIIMNKALIYYNELTAFDAYDHLKNNLPEPDCSNMEIEKQIASVYKMTMKNIKDFVLNDELENNDKLLKLKELLTDIFKSNPKTKVILLCQTRFNTIHLKNIIMDNPQLKKFVKAEFLIGQNDLTQKQQAGILKSFQSDELNLLIATSIAEQGLNISDCEIVIRYLYVTSDISRKQAHGRARKENSKCYLIAEEDNDLIIRDYRNKLREKEMEVALDEIAKMGTENFKEQVFKKIKFLHDEAEFLEKERNCKDYPFRAEEVNILCKECHNILCCGSDILKKGTEYICTNPDFESKVTIIQCQVRDFRQDTNIGKIGCNSENCANVFGVIKRYKSGDRLQGFVLSAQSILLHAKNTQHKSHLKKWKNITFPIQTENLG